VTGDLYPKLAAWFAAYGRELPWREAADWSWGVLVSEVMLQQTPVARVLEPWRRWMERWPTPAALAQAPTSELLRQWDRLGSPRRALRLKEAAQAIVAQHSGVVPDDYAQLVALPGVGDYTAAAVLSFAFHRRVVVLDTNIRRVLSRLYGGQALPPPNPRTFERVRAEALLPEDPAESVTWNIALMELGALVCLARSPRCPACPVRADCAWRQAGQPPDRQPRTAQPWPGSDRQARGVIMAALRDHPEGLAEAAARALLQHPDQADRAVAGLLADGLAVRVGDRLIFP